jgi:hypothetical protein
MHVQQGLAFKTILSRHVIAVRPIHAPDQILLLFLEFLGIEGGKECLLLGTILQAF